MNVEPTPASAASLDLLSTLLPRCTFAAPGESVVCALSGGPDSSALVALARAADLTVHAVHIDHQLRESSHDDAARARDVAAHLGASFTCERVTVGNGPNLEARARAARQRVLGPTALTGHTADDQAETVLLALMRGSGATGLSAMQPGPTKPILGLRRAETRALCDALELDTADDASNHDPRFRRNRIRHELLPLIDDIAERQTTPLITRAADLLRSDDQLLDELAARLDPTDAQALAAAPLPLARRSIRAWLLTRDEADRYPPDAATVERVIAVARGDAAGCDVSAGWRVERSHQRLRLFCDATPSG